MSDLLSRALLYARTARHLRWEQWVYRPIRGAQRLLPVRLPTVPAAASPRAPLIAHTVRGWGSGHPNGLLARAEAVRAGRFCFLNHCEQLTRIDWRTRYVSHLWSYNLHYFDYALDLAWAYRETEDPRYASSFESLALGWVEGNALGRGDGWDPYSLSLRAVNWMYALLLFRDAVGEESRRRLETSIHRQLLFLESRLERHILANHLLKNLKALVVGGLYFSGSASMRWARSGQRALWRELSEQVLPDGVHYERSPMYHAISLGDFLEIFSLLGATEQPGPPWAAGRLSEMVRTLGVLSRADGTLHLFNDSANGIAPSRDWLDAMARATLGSGIPELVGVASLPDAGFYAYANRSSGERLLVDCGEPGPRHQPGHAHCDLLSFELDLAGGPVIVDSGVSGYEGDPYREYVRSTRAHNTLSIGGREQAELWGTFRVARRPLVGRASLRFTGVAGVFEGEYAPFHDRSVRHRRRIDLADGACTVTDTVSGATGERLQSFGHLHPDFSVRLEDGRAIATSQRGVVEIVPFGADLVRVRVGESDPVQGWYCPEFGRALPAPVVEMLVVANDGREFGYTIRSIK